MAKTVLLRVTIPDEVGEEPEYIVNLALDRLLGNEYGIVTAPDEDPDAHPENVIVVQTVLAAFVTPRDL